jgi:murein DD-endopeptidase MepM/ murein hydrolase activator NlpD
MTEQSSQEFQTVNPAPTSDRDRLIKQSIGFVSGLSILGSGLICGSATATTNTFIIPDTSAPPAPPAPAKIVRPERQRTAVRVPTTRVAPKPTQIDRTISASPKPRLSAPKISVPAKNTTAIDNLVLQPQSAPPVANPGKNSFIDTTNYSRGKTDGYSAPSAVILTERSTGCSSISQNGKLSSGNCATTTKRQSLTAATRVRRSPGAMQVASRRTSGTLQSARLQQRRTAIGTVVQPPATIGLAPIAPQYHRATTNYYYPHTVQQPRNTALIFPLAMPATITSAFGWRVHPVTGNTRMHSGTDLGAPMGTPVLAAYPGEVAVADSLGGYGLTVILRHEKGTQESRYAHLSEIFVKPGDTVEQGAVIGRVGSTGLSTGPHLHFEWRYLTNAGWVAVDAGLHLEYALANMMQAMQMANNNVEPQG